MTEGYLLSGQRSELSGSCCRRGSREPMGARPAACVVGVDPSPVALKSARRRNTPIANGRLTLVTGDIEQVPAHPPAGRVLACHVLYFWVDRCATCGGYATLAPDGHIALGYQLRQHMPPAALRTFPGKDSPSMTPTTTSARSCGRQASPRPRSASSATPAISAAGSHWPRPRQATRPSHAAGQLTAARTATPE